VLVSQSGDEQKRLQAAWFDDESDRAWEIARPVGAPAFHRFLLEEKFRRGTAGILGRIRGMTALVVCGGSGMDAEFLARAGAIVCSSDISIGAVRRTRERGRMHGLALDVVVADLERLPFPDSSIDVVYVHDGLHHLERPLVGLAEMARVARHAVCVTEPARAALTAVAVRMGIALEREEAGNRVERLALDDVEKVLVDQGFRIIVAERYAMYYQHEPAWAVRFLSRPRVTRVARWSFHFANRLFGSLGNKLTVQAIREGAPR
jgi:ubiquinone/menaquinone biosynthesis C-methylase UbiE